jgi:hypothetical protein
MTRKNGWGAGRQCSKFLAPIIMAFDMPRCSVTVSAANGRAPSFAKGSFPMDVDVGTHESVLSLKQNIHAKVPKVSLISVAQTRNKALTIHSSTQSARS